ncbi:MAG: PEGA domain-containing protein [Rhodothermales bacterium]|nr:PEGA domain-containing protein [Rhodothermales bacterium]
MRIAPRVAAPLLLALVLPLANCASIVHGGEQEVSITSTPTNAAVVVDGMEAGRTPVVLDLERGDKHVVELRLEGYEPYQIQLDKEVDGWVWGNIVFGGLIGLAIDAGTGAMYKLTPDEIDADLVSSATAEAGQLRLAVVMTPQPGWERVGQLTPAP